MAHLTTLTPNTARDSRIDTTAYSIKLLITTISRLRLQSFGMDAHTHQYSRRPRCERRVSRSLKQCSPISMITTPQLTLRPAMKVTVNIIIAASMDLTPSLEVQVAVCDVVNISFKVRACLWHGSVPRPSLAWVFDLAATHHAYFLASPASTVDFLYYTTFKTSCYTLSTPNFI